MGSFYMSRVARTSTRGSLGGAKFTRSGQTGKNRRYDAINPCLFVVDLDGKQIRGEEEEEKELKDHKPIMILKRTLLINYIYLRGIFLLENLIRKS